MAVFKVPRRNQRAVDVVMRPAPRGGGVPPREMQQCSCCEAASCVALRNAALLGRALRVLRPVVARV
jgi:hypothetical protein